MNRWVKHFLVYGFGTVFLNAVPFFLIPIYTRAVSVPDYGVLELLNRSQDFALMVITMGMASTVATLFQMEQTREDKLQLYSTAIFLLGLTSLVFLLPLALAAPQVSRLLFQSTEYTTLVLMFLLATYLEVVFQISALFLQSELKSGLYVTAYSTRAVISLVCNSIFAFVLHLGLFGIALATLIHTGVAAIAVCGYTLSQTGAHFRREKIKGMFKFGLPLVPGALAMFVLNNGDRYFLNIYATRAQVGIYSVGYKLAAATSTLVLVPFLKLWSVKMVDVSRMPDGPKLIGKIATAVVGACVTVTLAMSLFGPYMLKLLASTDYEGATPIIPIVGLSYVLFAWTVIMDSSFYVTKRTDLKPWPLIAGCGVILPLYYFWVQRWGMMGAAWATLIGFATFCGVSYFLSQSVYRTRYEPGRMIALVMCAGITLLIGSRWNGISWENFVIRLLLVLAFAAAVWFLVLDDTERDFLGRQLAGFRRLGKGTPVPEAR